MKPWKLLLLVTCSTAIAGCNSLFSKKPEPVPEPEPVVKVKKLKEPVVQVHGFKPGKPSRGGLTDAHINFSNVSAERLQFVMFKTTAYDSKGRVVRAKKTNRPTAWLRVAGPFEPFKPATDHKWDKIWQSNDLACFEVEGVEIIYMDGANEYYNETRLGDIIDPALNNSCRLENVVAQQQSQPQ
ncbi:hypothetical protein GCM10011348_11330 [Marinobacterium nitratireducens]|uniref:Lipoprotein n=1 Tax=Marinobacterium nitratireducens TaxID=518897 RepID=A0A917ZC23_9GAMM|nr:hypothetical protein [Marinobacterium nitratireducens]GGO78719.1 hypothetical protein GCM10011348_11330 [Marinobacterium nitratireducens]